MATTQFGKYQLIKKLAIGGMAEVFLARQSMGGGGDGRHVVVKRILPHLAEDPEFIAMFQNEARVAAKFSHPNIAQIYDYGEENGTYFIAMEFVHGEDLGHLMRKAWSTGQWIALPLAIRIAASACEGLYYAHSKKDEEGRPLKVVHRDVSPQNILVSFDGSVKLVDFGIAKAADTASMTRSGAIKGKFAYMAPEQAKGKPLDARTDIFALGLVLYELMTGVRPLKRDSELSTLQAALECAIAPPSQVAEVPAELDEVVMRALAKAPDDRYKDARAFQVALDDFLVSSRTAASSVQVSELMATLFADRLEEESTLGEPNPSSVESSAPSEVSPAPPDWEEPEETAKPDTVKPSRKYSKSPSPVRQTDEEPLESTRIRPPTQTELVAPPVHLRAASSGGMMPQAPPRRSSTALRPVGPIAPGTSRRSGSRKAEPEPELETDEVSVSDVPKPAWHHRQIQRPEPIADSPPAADLDDDGSGRSRLLVPLLALGALLIVGVLLKDLLLNGGTPKGVPVLLTVTSNPKTRVMLISKDPSRKPVELGDTPLEKATGAVVGDTIVLQNPTFCLRHEEPIASGSPQEEKKFEKIFGEGQLKLTVLPEGLKDLTVWCDNQILGTVGIPLNLYEGKHSLELRGESLGSAVAFEVDIEKNKLNAQLLDLTGEIDK